MSTSTIYTVVEMRDGAMMAVTNILVDMVIPSANTNR